MSPLINITTSGMFIEPFIERALIAAMGMGLLCALLGVFVTARGMAFFSDTIAHAALLGIALGWWWNLTDLTIPMVVVSSLIAAGFLWLKENTSLMTDTIMALLLAGSVSLGMMVLSRLPSYRGDLHQYLFGNILSIGPTEMGTTLILLVLVVGWIFFNLNSLTLITTHQELAMVSGIKVPRLNFLFVLVLTLVVAVSIRLMGIILVTSLLVIPPAAARNLSRNFRQQILLSLLVGLTGGVSGVVISYQLNNVPTGPTIVLSCIALFLVFLAVGKWRARVIR